MIPDMEYVATNIRLPRKTLYDLKVRAAKERKSLAQLVREAIEQTFHIGPAGAGVDPKKDPFYSLIGACESGTADGARRHDRDIYGVKD